MQEKQSLYQRGDQVLILDFPMIEKMIDRQNNVGWNQCMKTGIGELGIIRDVCFQDRSRYVYSVRFESGGVPHTYGRKVQQAAGMNGLHSRSGFVRYRRI